MSELSHSDPFYSSKFGILWAKEHILEFQRERETFLESGVCKTVTELDADGTHNLLKLQLTEAMPVALNGHVLDVVYNLRSALDQVIYSVASLTNTLHLKGTPFFPIREDPAEFHRVLTDSVGKWITPEIADFISTLEPYKGGNYLVWSLNALCNAQKHGVIRPLPIGTRLGNLEGTYRGGERSQFFIAPQWDSVKNEVVLIRSPVNAKEDFKYEYAFEIVFDNIEGIAQEPVLRVLEHFLQMIESFVMAIEAETIRIGLV